MSLTDMLHLEKNSTEVVTRSTNLAGSKYVSSNETNITGLYLDLKEKRENMSRQSFDKPIGGFSKVPKKQQVVVDAFKISVQSNMSSWKQMGFRSKHEYDNYKQEHNKSFNDSNFSSIANSNETQIYQDNEVNKNELLLPQIIEYRDSAVNRNSDFKLAL